MSRTQLLFTTSLAALLVLTAAAAIASLVTLRRIRTDEAALTSGYNSRRETLERVRRGVLLSGTIARDYFAEPESMNAGALLANLAALKRETRAAIDRHPDPEFRSEVVAYWNVLDLMTELAGDRRAALDAYFRHQLAERRETMLRIADRIDRTLELDRERTQDAIAHVDTRFGRTLGAGLMLILGAGATISLWAARRMKGLEQETRVLAARLVNAQEEERRAIARDLHDEVGQGLSSLLLDLGKDERMHRVAASVERLVEEIRRIALALRPSMLDDLGLVPALEWQAREVAKRTGIDVQVIADEQAPELPDAHRTCVYRVVQEALQNCARHASASKIRVAFQCSSGGVRLRVEDDGQGFAATRTGGLGILGMKERVAQLGGQLKVQSEPGRGTTLTAMLPV